LNGSSGGSQYCATANWASGWLALTVEMMFPISALTLAIAGPMLPVWSTSRTMSGFGGISGVVIVFVTWIVAPGFTASSTAAGLTPAPHASAGTATKAVLASTVIVVLRIPVNTLFPFLGIPAATPCGRKHATEITTKRMISRRQVYMARSSHGQVQRSGVNS